MIKLALRNVFRHRLRTALTLAAIVSGVAGLILSGGFVQDSLLQLREATIHSQLGHLQIYKAGYYAHGSQAPYRYMIDRPSDVIDLLRDSRHVDDVMQRLQFAGVLNNGRADIPILGEGLEPAKEARLGSLITITAGRQLENRDTNGILLGEGVASASKLRPGTRATLLVNTAQGALNTQEFEVVGIFRSFSKDYDARAVRIPLSAARELLNVVSANAIVVSLKETERTNEIASMLQAKLDPKRYEVKTWNELADFYAKTAALYQREFAVLQIVILVAVILSVINSVNMAVFERVGEFGTLRALGNRGSTVFRLVVTEIAFLGLIGSGIGVLLGVLAAYAISAVGIPMPPPPNSNSGYIALIRVVPWVVASAALVGFFGTVAAALLPAHRVARVSLTDALRHNQ